jgi:sugar lactone lactonase YvrE
MIRVASALIPLIVLAAASPVHARGLRQSGTVQSGDRSIAFSTVTLYRAGTQTGIVAVPLGTAKTDARGFFSVAFLPPSDPDAVLYLIADGGTVRSIPEGDAAPSGAIALATVLGPRPVSGGVVINERSTVASAYAMAQFFVGREIAGTAPGLKNAAATVRNLADIGTGRVGSVLANPPNGLATSTMRQLNSLANMLAACVSSLDPTPCRSLFDLAASPGGGVPGDTLQAMVNIARSPWRNVTTLFELSQVFVVYAPALQSAPDAWTLAIRYNGNGTELDGPGNMAVDEHGNVWSTNNYQFAPPPPSPDTVVCGDNHVIKLGPTGVDAPGAPYAGGGLYGAGFGITLDPNGNVWLGNFGFQGSNCTLHPPNDSVSQFRSDGTAVSPDPAGFTAGNISQPQGTASDQQGNIWIANCGNDTVTRFLAGNPNSAANFSAVGLGKPFGLAIDADGNVWTANNGNDQVVVLAPSGVPLAFSPVTGGGLKAPLGIATDSLGNAWVANSGIIPVPCGSGQSQEALIGRLGNIIGTDSASVTLIRPTGEPAPGSPFTGGGLTIPWGIAVDGDDNVWVANFGGQRLTQLCGARPHNCPPGHRTGDAISPGTGYGSDGLTRNTGVVIDPSGNVWLANNWLNVPVQTNPGGHEFVVFIGIAAPVKTPLIGPPRRP